MVDDVFLNLFSRMFERSENTIMRHGLPTIKYFYTTPRLIQFFI